MSSTIGLLDLPPETLVLPPSLTSIRSCSCSLQAVALALDAHDREREMTSRLLRALCPQTLSRDQTASGFTRLLAAAEASPTYAKHIDTTNYIDSMRLLCHLFHICTQLLSIWPQVAQKFAPCCVRKCSLIPLSSWPLQRVI